HRFGRPRGPAGASLPWVENPDPGIRCRRPWSDGAISFQCSSRCLPFLNHGAIACPSDFDIAPVRFPSFLLETVEHIDGLLKLGDVHPANPAIGAIDADLVGAWSNLRKRSPVIGDFAALQLSQFVACQLPRRLGKLA